MRKQHLLKTMLLLCALIVGSSSVWADEYAKITSTEDLEVGKKYLIVYESSETKGYVMGEASSNYMSGIETTLSNHTLTAPESANVITLGGSTEGYTLQLSSNSQYLYGTNNTNLSTNSTVSNNTKWTISFDASGNASIRNVATTTRYVRNYTSNHTFRHYATTNGEIVQLYKEVDASASSISANNINVAYNAISGSISYTINNTVEGATLTASTTDSWISNFTYETEKVNFAVSKNTTLADRTGTVTLTYANGGTTLATKAVTVTQGHLDVVAPTFSPAAGTYNATQNVTISSVTGGATIYYTTDGSVPTISSDSYSGAITVDANMTLKAIAVKDEVSSTVSEAAYTLKVTDPTISPNGSSFEESQLVTLACETSGATIKYTIDGSDPTTEGALTYTVPFTLTDTKTVKAIAIIDGWTASAVVTAAFTKIDPNDVWVKTGLSSLASDDLFAIIGNNGDTYAMSNNNSTTASPAAVAVTISNNMISSNEVGNTIKWTVSGNANDGYTFYPNGTTTNWLYCTNSNSGMRVGTGNAKHFTIADNGYFTITETQDQRYIGIYQSQDWRCYKSKTESNIAGQSFAIYKQGISVTLASACTDGTKYYSTFSSSVPFKVPEDVTVSEIGISSEGKLVFEEYETGAVVPANTGVMVSATTPGKKTFTPAAGGTSVLGDNNCLRPSGFDISDITATAMAAADEDCLYYRLTMHNGSTIGFWWGAENGAAFTLAANKAYLAIPASQGSRGFSFAEDTTTGIE